MTTKLVLIDGIAGTGKTAITRNLAATLAEKNINVHEYSDNPAHHPVQRLTFSTYNSWLKEIQTNWKTFVLGTVESEKLVIFDGTIFYNTLGTLLAHDVFEENIMLYASQVPPLIQSLEPVLIHLTVSDVERHIRNMYRMRPPQYREFVDSFIQKTAFGKSRKLNGLHGFCEFNRKLHDICDQVYKNFPFRKMEINISYSQWQFYEKLIEDFIQY